MSGLNFDSLPLKRSLEREYLISSIVAFIMLLASAAGIIFRDVMYPTDELLVGFVSTDLLNIAVGLPILLVSMYLARRGRLGGLLCWPGALFYVLYIYTTYMGIPTSWMRIPHIIQIVLSVYLIIAIVSSIDSEAVRHRLDGAVPAKSIGGILFGIGVLIIAWVAVQIGTAIINQVRPERMALVQIINDLMFGCPALVISGYLLLRRRSLGYVSAVGMLLLCSLLFIGVIPAMVFQARAADVPIDVVGIFVVFFTGMICFIPLALFLRGVAKTGKVQT